MQTFFHSIWRLKVQNTNTLYIYIQCEGNWTRYGNLNTRIDLISSSNERNATLLCLNQWWYIYISHWYLFRYGCCFSIHFNINRYWITYCWIIWHSSTVASYVNMNSRQICGVCTYIWRGVTKGYFGKNPENLLPSRYNFQLYVWSPFEEPVGCC